MLGSILCRLRGHRPDRGLARHDGQDYWTRCKRCGQPLIRGLDAWSEPTPDAVRAHQNNVKLRSGFVSDAGLNDSN